MSSSRSTKVIEELQETWEAVQKELAQTKAQLASARELKAQAEEDTKIYTEANRTYRTNIQELMQVLESKQRTLDATKQASRVLESQVKKLKDEALASRKQLEELRRKEQVLERDRDVAVADKQRAECQRQALTDAVAMLGTRFARELASLQTDLATVNHLTRSIGERAQTQALMIETKMTKQMMLKRKEYMEQLIQAKHHLESNTQAFVDHVQTDLQSLIDNIDKATGRTDDFQNAVLKCRGEVNGLINRIRTYTEASGVD
ncbi:hypothetical protein EC973_000167 [Apophysomyces ossiformis]|uniref:SWI5-dependent HO expression protein 3 n=1 Tax=Apophysomyces ossiformis TaxID=679940 RepID=A0A8H7BWQ9_9FUNG|nr:hypothetical protein EC973_000167 [Apophysomyces ossiformis]